MALLLLLLVQGAVTPAQATATAVVGAESADAVPLACSHVICFPHKLSHFKKVIWSLKVEHRQPTKPCRETATAGCMQAPNWLLVIG